MCERKPCHWCEVEGRCKNKGASAWTSEGPEHEECMCICHFLEKEESDE